MPWITVGTWWDMVIVYLWCSQVLPGICHRVWKLWAPWYHGRCVLHPCWGDMDMATWWAFPLVEAKLLSEEGIGAWSLDGRWWTTKSRDPNSDPNWHPKIEATNAKLLEISPESPQLWFPARKMTTLPCSKISRFVDEKFHGQLVQSKWNNLVNLIFPFDNQADCKRQVTWSRSCNLCCVARLSSCNDANDNAFLEHASMMCVTFEGHKNSAICSSQQSIGKHLYTFVGIYPSFASFNFVSSSWHSLSCCKSRLKREDFCKGGGCCGRRMGAGIAVTLAGLLWQGHTAAQWAQCGTCEIPVKLQKNALGNGSHVLNLCWKSSWGLTLLVAWAFSLAGLDPEGWPQNNQLKSASLMSVGDK